MKSLREELELRRKTEIHEIEEVHKVFLTVHEELQLCRTHLYFFRFFFYRESTQLQVEDCFEFAYTATEQEIENKEPNELVLNAK